MQTILVMHSRRIYDRPFNWLSVVGSLAIYGIHWIPFLMFFFFVWKIKSPAGPILFKFPGRLCYGLICSHCRNAIFSSKNTVSWATGSLCHAFSDGLNGKMKIKVCVKENKTPSKIIVEFWCLILWRPSKIKSNEENEVFWKNGVKTCAKDVLLVPGPLSRRGLEKSFAPLSQQHLFFSLKQ